MSLDIFSKQKQPSLKILGASGGKSNTTNLTSIQLSTESVIDAGNLIRGFEGALENIENIFLTHVHLDHIVDIPFLLDNIHNKQTKPIKIYTMQENIDHLKTYIFNWEIWPDFSLIPMPNSKEFCLEFIPIEYNQPIKMDSFIITPIENNHTAASCGFIIEKENNSILFTSDTYCCDSIWEKVNNDLSISTVVIDVSFPSNLNTLAKSSKHLTPELLESELKKLTRDDVTIHINHLKPTSQEQVSMEIYNKNLLLNNGSILQTGDIIHF